MNIVILQTMLIMVFFFRAENKPPSFVLQSILGMTVGKFLSCFNSYTEFVYVSTNPNLAAFNSAMGIMRAIGSMAMMYQMIGGKYKNFLLLFRTNTLT